MKKIIIAIFVCILLTGCNSTLVEQLDGNDKKAYNLMLEVCYVADDPSHVKVISGSVSDSVGVFKVSYNNGEEVYNILVSEENGKYIASRLHEELISNYSSLLYATDNFDISKVNKALKEKWNKQ